jgi:hypothetical protein
MNDKPGLRRYEEAATRFEHRGEMPPDRVYVDRYVKAMVEAGVEAAWQSAVSPAGMPLFPSKVFPVSHPNASLEAFHYMIESFHDAGIPMISWYGLIGSESVAKVHPEWRVEFYHPENIDMAPWQQAGNSQRGVPDANHFYLCYNSPYGELLPEFCLEIVETVGFDGIYFDASTLSYHSSYPMYLPGCRCGFCRARFRDDTGLDLPERLDTNDSTACKWIQWRYDLLVDLLTIIIDAVTAIRPEAVIVWNNYRRRSHAVFGWNTAMPLRWLVRPISTTSLPW